ncbi:MAG: hypothetical protein K0U66_07090 [Gammaproteobacteria bacterium]|nr:hypothetical protein [Gammaproteobacteria bacterium]
MSKTQKLAALAVILLGAGVIYSYGGFSLARLKERLTTKQVVSKLARDLRRDFGLNDAQAAGVIANLWWESGGFQQFQEINPIQTSRPGRELGGFGYAQWTGPRRRDFNAWVKKNDLDRFSYAANYGFLRHELRGKERGVLPALKGAQSAPYATAIFEEKFLRAGVPHLAKRQAISATVYEQIRKEGVA